jgi:BirA family biotin operon repressor/biotin-[acetyl-CoA-carboxylase] ligase
MLTPHANAPAAFVWDCERAREFDLACIAEESFVRGIIFRRRLESTNNLGLEWTRDGQKPTPLLVLTEDQRAGRGRGANRWWSAPGALTFSLVLDSGTVAPHPDLWPRVSLAAAVAVCEVLEQIAPHVPCGIRWPNDVDLASRKICGVLAEPPGYTPADGVQPSGGVGVQPTPCGPGEDVTRECERQPSRLVVGIGINLNNSLHAAPRDVQSVGTSLIDLTGARHDPTDFLLHLLRRLANTFEALAHRHPAITEAWSRRCRLHGRTVELQAGPLRVRGVCRGIDSDGALIVLTHAGPRRFLGGRIVHYDDGPPSRSNPQRYA